MKCSFYSHSRDCPHQNESIVLNLKLYLYVSLLNLFKYKHSNSNFYVNINIDLIIGLRLENKHIYFQTSCWHDMGNALLIFIMMVWYLTLGFFIYENIIFQSIWLWMSMSVTASSHFFNLFVNVLLLDFLSYLLWKKTRTSSELSLTLRIAVFFLILQ